MELVFCSTVKMMCMGDKDMKAKLKIHCQVKFIKENQNCCYENIIIFLQQVIQWVPLNGITDNVINQLMESN